MMRLFKAFSAKLHKVVPVNSNSSEVRSRKVNVITCSYSKKAIPKALRNTVWETYIGQKFNGKCQVEWCKSIINPFTFEVGHNVPESKGGSTTLDNLRPICAQCNKSMGNRYTIDEFSDLYRVCTDNIAKTKKRTKDIHIAIDVEVSDEEVEEIKPKRRRRYFSLLSKK